MIRTRVLAAIVLATFSGTSAARAQRAGLAPHFRVRAVSMLGGRDSTLSRARIEAPAILKGEPRSVQLIAVDLPASMPHNRKVSFTVFSTGTAAILSRRTGELDARSDKNPRVLVTLGVQAHALAGRTTVAEVEFTAPGVESAVVPVVLDVTAIRRIEVMAMTQLVVARLGEKSRVRYRVTNLGNGTDTVKVRIAGQDGWVSRSVGDAAVVLPVAASAEGLLTVAVPPFAATGVNALQLVAEGESGERGRGTLFFEVTPTSQIGGSQHLAILPSLAMVAQGSDVRDVIFGVGIGGRAYRNISVDGHWQQQPKYGAPGLGRVGGYGTLPYLSVFTNLWRLDAGNAAVSFSELTGLSAQGRGASFTFNGERWSLLSLAARPTGIFTLSDGRSAEYYGARVGRSFGETKVNSGITHLDDGRVAGGKLDAFSVGASSDFSADSHVDGELGYRSFDGGTGLGAVANFDEHSRLGALRLRLSHAPGGAGAFALATNNASLFATKTLAARTKLGLNSWYSDNTVQDQPQQRSRGASVSPSFGLSDHLSVGGEVRATSFDFTDGAQGDRIGNSSRSATVFANSQIRSISFGGYALYSVDTRSAPGALSALLSSRQRQVQWNAQAATNTRVGVVELTWSAQMPLGAPGFLTGQNETQLRLHEVRVPVFGRDLLMGAVLGRVGSFGSRATIYTQRFEAGTMLPGSVSMMIDAERNPLFSYGGTRGGWSTAMRLNRSIDIPSLGGGGAGGEVFEDANGNGVRDRGEAGLSGVIIRAGGEVAVTDVNGRYRFARESAALPQMDERTLPYGWVLGPQRGARVRDFPVVPLSAVEVQLQITGAIADRLAAIDLSPVVLVARDSADRAWIARMDRTGLGRFDALPPGRYRVELDMSRVLEPLNAPTELPSFRTTASREPQRITLAVSSRPIRIWRADSLQRAPLTAPVVSGPVARPEADVVGAPAIAGEPTLSLNPATLANTIFVPHLSAPTLPVLRSRFVAAHKVVPNEYLRLIAQHYLRDENRWPEIFALNRERIRHPDLVRAGIQIDVPIMAADDSTSRKRVRRHKGAK